MRPYLHNNKQMRPYLHNNKQMRHYLHNNKQMIPYSQQQQTDEALSALQTEIDDLAQQQIELLDDLKNIQQTLSLFPPELKQPFSTAGQAMQEASDALTNSMLDQAVQAQTQALDALQKGFDQLVEQMRNEQQNSVFGYSYSPIGSLGSNGRDPLGRALSRDGDSVPSANAKTFQILDQIRNRISERNRTQFEREYLERLLDLF